MKDRITNFFGFWMVLPFIFLLAWSERQWKKERAARGELYCIPLLAFFLNGCVLMDGLKQSTGYTATDDEYFHKHPNEHQVPCDDKIHRYDICVAER